MKNGGTGFTELQVVQAMASNLSIGTKRKIFTKGGKSA